MEKFESSPQHNISQAQNKMSFHFVSKPKPRYLFSAWVACIFIGIGTQGSVALGQEKCEDDSILKKIEPVENNPDDSRVDKWEGIFSRGKTELESDEIQSLDDKEDSRTDQAQSSNLVQRPISQIGLSLNAQLPTPELKRPPSTTENFLATDRTEKNYQWTAPNDYYRNLLFEEPLLERHGISKNPKLQPVISGFHFFKSSILLPLDMAKGYHRRCDNPLGWGVPGDHCR